MIFLFIKFPKDKVNKVYNREGLYGVDKLIFDPLNHIPENTLSVGSINPSSDGKKLLIAYSAKRIGSSDIKRLPLSDSLFWLNY
jgi:prolyl oligopeptidase